ncbi:MAG: transcriptional regulator [Acidimicrobiaceae bacterium]|nr:transcriptional regulator [Acidimicrobiaceae bacterium]
MYLPDAFAQRDREAAAELIRRVGIAELVSSDGRAISASTIPMLLDESAGPHGALLGHVARANSQWSSFSPEIEALAIFRGPDAYVSPSWYATKAEHGRVVPTWDYATVHVRGRLVVHDDEAWKRTLVTRLTQFHEAKRLQPWSVDDAPVEYVDAQLRAIVGLELVITKLEAKWKLSQNQPVRNREGVVAGLEQGGTPRQLEVAEMVRATADQAGANGLG